MVSLVRKYSVFKMVIALLIVFLFFCKPKSKNETNFNLQSAIKQVTIATILQDTTLNIRALELNNTNKEELLFATSDGRIGIVTQVTNPLKNKKGDVFKVTFPYVFNDNEKLPNFRSMAITTNGIFSLSIASPAYLFKNDSLVFQDDNEKAFYDSMAFWNAQEGIAIGDPIANCMRILITRDGGTTWKPLACSNLPKIKEGEAAFAASNTNIAIVDNHTWVGTGGKSSRILYSPDKGKNWKVYQTPIVQGKPTTGIYSVAFYDTENGFAIGGDYTQPTDSTANKIRTTNGGKTWQLVAANKSPGYRSCVQYVPNSAAKKLVAVGFKGIDVSNDAGNTWQHLSDTGFYTIRFVNDSTAFAAGKGSISKLIFQYY